MDFRDLDIDDKILVSRALESLMRARQAAYVAAKQVPGMKPTFDAAEKAYADAVETFKVRYVPVFDEEQHVEKRIAEGDRDHTFVRDSRSRPSL